MNLIWRLEELSFLYVHSNNIVLDYSGNQKKCILNYNIGSGRGYSVLEIIKGIEKVTKVKLKIVFKNKRKGDPPILVADCKKILKHLKWKPKYKNINKIILTAWQWHKKSFI